MNTVQEIRRINEAELASGSSASWHDQVSLQQSHVPCTSRSADTDRSLQYKDSAYIHVGGLPFNLTEGDVITIFSQCVARIAVTDARVQARVVDVD